jgi:hypothetical protein
MNSLNNVILYGAGSNLSQALDFLLSVRIHPVCICDGNAELWHATVKYVDRYTTGEGGGVNCPPVFRGYSEVSELFTLYNHRI